MAPATQDIPLPGKLMEAGSSTPAAHTPEAVGVTQGGQSASARFQSFDDMPLCEVQGVRGVPSVPLLPRQQCLCQWWRVREALQDRVHVAGVGDVAQTGAL